MIAAPIRCGDVVLALAILTGGCSTPVNTITVGDAAPGEEDVAPARDARRPRPARDSGPPRRDVTVEPEDVRDAGRAEDAGPPPPTDTGRSADTGRDVGRDAAPDVGEDASADLDTGRDAVADASRDVGEDVAPAADVPRDVPPPAERTTEGLVALYTFDDPDGILVHDRSGVDPPLHLVLANPEGAVREPGSLTIEGAGTMAATAGPPARLIEAIRQSGELTIEAWLTPVQLEHRGPARIVNISENRTVRNLTLGHGNSRCQRSDPSTQYSVRLRTTASNNNGCPELNTPLGFVWRQLTHVVFRRRPDGPGEIWVDGIVATARVYEGDLSNWSETARLSLGGEFGADRTWYGRFHLVAIFDRALSDLEVLEHLRAGPGGP